MTAPRADSSSVPPITENSLQVQLMQDWESALGGDENAQAQWHISEGGYWVWQSAGLFATNSGTEWADFRWDRCGATSLKELGNFVIEVMVSGNAAAAGLSFGPFKDFLAPVTPGMGARQLQVEVDASAGLWTFRVDGQLAERCWWDSAVQSVDDLVGGTLTLKARNVEQVRFHALCIRTFQATCQLSIIMTCYRFAQRLRISLRNWCGQTLPAHAYEVLVVNPNSPDGTHEHLAAVASAYPHVRVREIVASPQLATNKGAMINRGIAASRGTWV